MNDESKLYGISVRSFITVILTITICAMAIVGKNVVEPLYSAFLLALGFYFGQKTMPNQKGNENEKVTT